jgi:coenzyme F420-reducing hydrogenase delta subunit/Pyruvate/2-oxoacid:ferredoxin oxidoreductase delta subunit
MIAACAAALRISGGAPQGLETRSTDHGTRAAITAYIDRIRCRGCEDCEAVCGLHAIRVAGEGGSRVAQVDASLCLGCAVCVAVCSSGAIFAGDTSDAQADAMLAAMGDLSDKTIVFCCNWGAYSAIEAAGLERLSYDASVRVVRLMCAGQAHAGLILRAFARGAARVLILACGNEGDASQCRYHTGNGQARRSTEQAQRLLGLLGIDPSRLGLHEMIPGDGAAFVAAVRGLSRETAAAMLREQTGDGVAQASRVGVHGAAVR